MRPRSWWPDLAFLAGFVVLTALLANGHLLGLDTAVADWVRVHQPRPLYWTARVLNYLGQGGQVLMPVSLLLAGWVIWRRRELWPLYLFAGAAVLTYVTIGPLKIWLDRAAPRFPGPDPEILFNPAAGGDLAMSYPSGHVANALVWYGVIAVLLGSSSLALRIVPPVIVFATTTYLAFHWITDSIAGLLLGLVLTRLLARVPWQTLRTPRRLLSARA